MRHKVLTLVLVAMVASNAALPHHPIFFGNSPPRHGFMGNRDVMYSPFYGNMGRVHLVSVPQYVTPGQQLVFVPPGQAGVSYVPVQQSQHPLPSKDMGLNRDQINFCKVVGNSLATTPPSALLLEEPLVLEITDGENAGIAAAPMLKSAEGPRRRQSVGPINLNYMCKRITRLPIPGQIGVPTLVRYCKRLAHTIASAVPFILRQLPVNPYQPQVPEIHFTGLYEAQKPQRAIPTEAYNAAVLCQTMITEIVTNTDNVDYKEPMDADEPTDETKPSLPVKPMKPVEPMESMAMTDIPMDTITDSDWKEETAVPEESTEAPEGDEEVNSTETIEPTKTMEEEKMKPMKPEMSEESMDTSKSDEEVKPMETVIPMKPMEEGKIEPIEPAMPVTPMKPVQAVEPLVALDLSQLPVLPIQAGIQGLSGIKFLIKNPIPSHIRQFIIVSPPESGLIQQNPADTYVLQHNQPQPMQQFVLHQTQG